MMMFITLVTAQQTGSTEDLSSEKNLVVTTLYQPRECQEGETEGELTRRASVGQRVVVHYVGESRPTLLDTPRSRI